MKRVFALLIISIFLISFVSAEIIIQEQPKELYNLGETIKIPVKVSALENVEEFFNMVLICNGIETEIHKQYVSLEPGSEQEISAASPLSLTYLGKTTGTCTIKASLGDDFALTNEFKISNLINVKLEEAETNYNPGDSILFEGTAIKENGENAQGFVDVVLMKENSTEEILATDTVNDGYFSIQTPIKEDMKAGDYLLKVKVYEKEAKGNISNQGVADYNIHINQVPTSLEILFEQKDVEPDSTLKVKAILHDQTGEKIDSNAIITIRNSKNKIVQQGELSTEEILEQPIAYNEPASEWKVTAESNELTTEENFNIIEKENAEINIVNKTLFITNKGNVPYNETILVKIGEEIIEVNSFLNVDEEKKYKLSAPDGEYEVEVDYGEEKLSKVVTLTGNSIKVSEASNKLGIIKTSFVWMFMVMVLGFVTFLVYKKGYKKSFIGYITKRKSKPTTKAETPQLFTLTKPKEKAELSLSIKGDTQDISLICLKIKNQKEINKNQTAKEILQKTTEIAEQHKAVVYENQNSILYMFVPLKTKTYKNQKTAVIVSEEIKELLDKYNKIGKEKIQYGLSLNYGTIVAKQEKETLKFMSMGTLITTAKKLATLSTGEILLSEKMNEKVLVDVKTQKHEKQGVKVYTIQEIKRKKEDNKKFIQNFIKKLEKENKESKKKSQNNSQ